MQLNKYIIWTTTILVLGVIIMGLIPNAGLIAFGLIALPALIIVLAILILRSKEESKKTFDDEWYDK